MCISPALHLDPTLDGLGRHVLLEGTAALEGYHCLIDRDFAVWLVDLKEPLLQHLDHWSHFSQAIIPRVTMFEEGTVVSKVEKAVNFSKSLPGDSVCNRAVVQQWITAPVIIYCW